jgi:hypothetical protein
MRRRHFLGLTAAAISAPRMKSQRCTFGHAKPGPVRIQVQPDERIHPRIFPRPPMVDLLDRIPHDWLTTFEDMEQWQRNEKGESCLEL